MEAELTVLLDDEELVFVPHFAHRLGEYVLDMLVAICPSVRVAEELPVGDVEGCAVEVAGGVPRGVLVALAQALLALLRAQCGGQVERIGWLLPLLQFLLEAFGQLVQHLKRLRRQVRVGVFSRFLHVVGGVRHIDQRPALQQGVPFGKEVRILPIGRVETHLLTRRDVQLIRVAQEPTPLQGINLAPAMPWAVMSIRFGQRLVWHELRISGYVAEYEVASPQEEREEQKQ